jgi:hypothetical protein
MRDVLTPYQKSGDHLLVAGSSLATVSFIGALLGDAFATTTLAHTPRPLQRVCSAQPDPALVAVALVFAGSEAAFEEDPANVPGRLIVITPDGSRPCRLPADCLVLSASEPPAVLQASIVLLAARQPSRKPSP